MKQFLFVLMFWLLTATSAFADDPPVSNFADPNATPSLNLFQAQLIAIDSVSSLQGDKRIQALWVLTCLIDYHIAHKDLGATQKSAPTEVREKCTATYSNSTETSPSVYSRTPYQSNSEKINSLVASTKMVELLILLQDSYVKNTELLLGASCVTDFLRVEGSITQEAFARCLAKATPILKPAFGI